MIVLALDTAGVDCSVALYDRDRDLILAQESETIGKGHAERLMAMTSDVLAKAGLDLSSVGRIAVCIGPGSFTGIRVGVAAARGFALSLNVDAVGVTTLETLAAAHLETLPGRPVAAVMDAKRDEVYAQVFASDGTPLTEPQAMSPGDAAALALLHDACVTGSAAPLLEGAAQGGPADHFSVGHLARIGANRALGGDRPKPLYLRGPDAKPQQGFAIARV